MAVTKNDLESEVAKVTRRLDKIEAQLEDLRKTVGQLFGTIKKKR